MMNAEAWTGNFQAGRGVMNDKETNNEYGMRNDGKEDPGPMLSFIIHHS